MWRKCTPRVLSKEAPGNSTPKRVMGCLLPRMGAALQEILDVPRVPHM